VHSPRVDAKAATVGLQYSFDAGPVLETHAAGDLTDRVDTARGGVAPFQVDPDPAIGVRDRHNAVARVRQAHVDSGELRPAVLEPAVRAGGRHRDRRGLAAGEFRGHLAQQHPAGQEARGLRIRREPCPLGMAQQVDGPRTSFAEQRGAVESQERLHPPILACPATSRQTDAGAQR
jgi:hypothetical protein